ncbi:MAG: hypothetical protein SF052_03045 [Bacteroidia bacterium]|nr:hypothetical protein [Bacteroidia bacterium]
MSFNEDFQKAFKGLAVDIDSFKFDISRRISWLWDPPEDYQGSSYSQVFAEREDKRSIIRISNANELNAQFYPIDKAIIREQKDGQCDGLIVIKEADEKICWIELKMNITTHSKSTFHEKLDEGLGQIENTLLKFREIWWKKGLIFPAETAQVAAIAIPAKPARLRQTPANFKVKAEKKLRGIKIFLVSEIELPDIKPKRGNK